MLPLLLEKGGGEGFLIKPPPPRWGRIQVGVAVSNFIVVFVTCGSEDEALKIARTLVEERLAACANMVSPLRSIYRWEGKIWDEKEWLLIIKTQQFRFEDLAKRVKALHSYSVPEIIALPITESSPAYLNWIEENTK
jgi:periplasmic divalent cation tolerance protein